MPLAIVPARISRGRCSDPQGRRARPRWRSAAPQLCIERILPPCRERAAKSPYNRERLWHRRRDEAGRAQSAL